MHVSEIWRYPVKSMRGQRVPEIDVLETGLQQDRRIVVARKGTGRIITARTHPGLLGLSAAVQDDGSITVEGLPWNSPRAAELTSQAIKEDVELIDMSTDTERFDVLPLLVASDGAIHELGIDGRRLRPNIVVGGVPGVAERQWPGHDLQLGAVRIHAAQLRGRCVMTTFDPDTLVQDRSVLKRIVTQMQGKAALDSSVITPGHLRENDAVEVL